MVVLGGGNCPYRIAFLTTKPPVRIDFPGFCVVVSKNVDHTNPPGVATERVCPGDNIFSTHQMFRWNIAQRANETSPK
jgi:hypothetical protein